MHRGEGETERAPRVVQLGLLAAAVLEKTAGLPLYVDHMAAHLLVQVRTLRRPEDQGSVHLRRAQVHDHQHIAWVASSRCSQALRRGRGCCLLPPSTLMVVETGECCVAVSSS